MRILVCTSKMPHPLLSGEAVRIYNISKRLSQSHDVYLFSFIGSANSQQDFNLLKLNNIFRDLYYLKLPTQRIANRLIGLSVPIPEFYWRLRYSGLGDQARTLIAEIIKEKRIDAVHSCRELMGLLLASLTDIPKVLDLQDSGTLFYKRKLRLSLNPVDVYLLCRTMASEKYLLSRFDVTTVVSPVDREYLSRLNNKAKIKVVPIGVDPDFFQPAAHIGEDYPSMLFHGVMNYDPNVDSVLYTCREILPIIRARIPEVKFYIVGMNPSPEIRRLAENNRIIVTGYVEDLREHILRASVILVPMRKGRGMKNKILEAMALGKPVVTTPMGAEGLDQDTQDCIVIAETPAEIAEKALTLLENRDAREELGRNASQIVGERYNWETCAEIYEETYRSLLRL